MLLLAGAVMETLASIKSLLRRDAEMANSISFGLFALAFAGYLAFEILYALQYRSLTVLKAIFIYPALLSFPVLFLRSAQRLYAHFSEGKRWPLHVFEGGLYVLLVMYAADVGFLVLQLARIYLQKHGAA